MERAETLRSISWAVVCEWCVVIDHKKKERELKMMKTKYKEK